MTDREFILSFSRFKREFLQQSGLEKGQLGVLEMFEKWLQMRDNDKHEENIPASGTYFNIIKDWRVLLEDICRRVEKYLMKRGIVIKCLSAAHWGQAKGSALCLVLPNRQDIFYRLCRTQPRKGPYSGQKIIKGELVLDGHKHSLFLPLLHYQAEMERRLGFRLERESARVEESGKYRFKICFPLNKERILTYDCDEIARLLTEFIFVTQEYIEKINAAKTG
ncbi:hypothetical protein J2Z49_001869 [Desulfofundulus luciae]|uniref:Uncharacterized protein n=1 Tax=Desulfofundulus luciae TaxID=74702 RepID=A0ABU0B211_9FIRM|nr:hypothetical protein [Desulfofundulus luciae]MDQ0286752.1 hypothetical protein [Desulfofundulus luciae]